MVWLILSIAVWGAVHSWMASLKCKEFIRRVLGNGGMKFYRLFYNLFSVFSIAPIFYLMLALPDKDFYQIPTPWNTVMLAGQGLAVLLLFVAVLQTDVLAFVGLRQLFQEEQPGKLVTRGFYRMVRHPLNQNKVGVKLANQLQSLIAVLRGRRHIAFFRQDLLAALTQRLFVINDQNALTRSHHAPHLLQNLFSLFKLDWPLSPETLPD